MLQSIVEGSSSEIWFKLQNRIICDMPIQSPEQRALAGEDLNSEAEALEHGPIVLTAKENSIHYKKPILVILSIVG